MGYIYFATSDLSSPTRWLLRYKTFEGLRICNVIKSAVHTTYFSWLPRNIHAESSYVFACTLKIFLKKAGWTFISCRSVNRRQDLKFECKLPWILSFFTYRGNNPHTSIISCYPLSPTHKNPHHLLLPTPILPSSVVTPYTPSSVVTPCTSIISCYPISHHLVVPPSISLL